MTRPYAPGHRIPTDLLLKAYASGVFPMAESASRPGSVLGAPGNARHHPARCFPRPEKPGQDDPARPLRDDASTPISKASSTAAPRRATSAATPGSTRRSAKPMSSSTGAATAIRSKPGATGGWSAGSTACRSAAPSSAKACFRASATRRRSAWCTWSSGCNERRFALLDTQFTTEHLKRFGAVDVPRRKYEKLLAKTLEGEAQFFP